MLNILKAKHQSILGIDISSSSVKILEIAYLENKFRVEAYGRDILPLSALDGNVIKDVQEVGDCIKKLIDSLGLINKRAALAVPDASVISKIIQINDGLSNEEMEEFVLIEADKYIPYPVDEISLDFEILGHSSPNLSMLDVLIVASRTENVNTRAQAVALAGLDVVIVDVESYAVERAAQKIMRELQINEKNKLIAIIDIGVKVCHLFVFDGIKLIFSREDQFGGMPIVDAISSYYKITSEEAYEAIIHRTLPVDCEQALFAPFKEMLLLQIKRTLQFFYSTRPHGIVEHILLAGTLARLSGLAKLIQQQLGVITTIANPFEKMSFNKLINFDMVNNHAPGLMVSCGLALRNIE